MLSARCFANCHPDLRVVVVTEETATASCKLAGGCDAYMSWSAVAECLGLRSGEYMRIRTMIMGPGKGKGKQGMLQQMGKQMGKHGAMNPHNAQMNVQQMARMLPPQVRPHAWRLRTSAGVGHWVSV